MRCHVSLPGCGWNLCPRQCVSIRAPSKFKFMLCFTMKACSVAQAPVTCVRQGISRRSGRELGPEVVLPYFRATTHARHCGAFQALPDPNTSYMPRLGAQLSLFHRSGFCAFHGLGWLQRQGFVAMFWAAGPRNARMWCQVLSKGAVARIIERGGGMIFDVTR